MVQPNRSSSVKMKSVSSDPSMSLVRSADRERPDLRLQLEPQFLEEHVLVEFLAERVLRHGIGRQVERRADEIAVVDELLQHVAVPEDLGQARPGGKLPVVVERQPRFVLVVVRPWDVEV